MGFHLIELTKRLRGEVHGIGSVATNGRLSFAAQDIRICAWENVRGGDSAGIPPRGRLYNRYPK